MASGNDKDIKIGIAADTSGADEAKRALEGVKKAAEEAGAASPDNSASSTAAASQTDAGQSAEDVLKENAAIDEQLEMVRELVDLEFGVIDLRKKDVQAIIGVAEQQKKLAEEAKKEEAFKALFSPERMAEVKKEFGKLGQAVADFGREFAKTEEGQKMLEGLSEETKAFGSVALNVVGSVANGFATGGPIGAAMAGLTSAFQQVAGEYLDAQKRIEESNRQLARAEAEAFENREKKRKAAATREIEEQLRRENDELDDQNEALRENEQLMKSRRDVAKAEFELKQAQDEAGGKSREQLDTERVQFELQEKDKELSKRRWDRQIESNIKDSAAVKAKTAAEEIGSRYVNGTNSPEYKAAMEVARRAREAADDDKRQLPKDLEGIENERKTAGIRAATELTRISTRAGKEQERESQREKEKKQDQDRENERKGREKIQGEIEHRREGLDDSARDAAGRFSEAAGKLKLSGKAPALAGTLGKIGVGLSDGADEKEIERLAAEFKQATAGIKSGTLTALQEILKAQQEQAAEIRKLQGQGKKGDLSHRK